MNPDESKGRNYISILEFSNQIEESHWDIKVFWATFARFKNALNILRQVGENFNRVFVV